MKKVFIFILTVTILATVFSGILQNMHTSTTPAGTNTALIIDQLAPVIAYADSDTTDGGNVPPPPPPPIF